MHYTRVVHVMYYAHIVSSIFVNMISKNLFLIRIKEIIENNNKVKTKKLLHVRCQNEKKNRNNFENFRALREFVFQSLKSLSLRSLQKAEVAVAQRMCVLILKKLTPGDTKYHSCKENL